MTSNNLNSLTPELIQTILSLVDAGMKHPELGGARLAMQGATVLQWLQGEQQKINATNVADVRTETTEDTAVESHDVATDLEGKS